MRAPSFNIERVQKTHGIDAVLLASLIVLVGLGLVTLFSASAGFAERFFDDRAYFLKKQLIFTAEGLVLFLLGMWVDPALYRRYIMPLSAFAFIFCLLPFIPGLGVTKNGATRWVNLGFLSYQPSELVKLVLPIYLAHIFAKKEERLDDPANGVLPPAIVTALFCLVVYLQNDFHTAAFIGLTALLVFFLAGVRLRHFLALGAVSLPMAFLLIFTKEFRVQRLIAFIRPEADPMDAGYQVRTSVATLASGGFWGKGIGQGTRKIASVPEIHSDFVFAAFGEEAGYIGVILFFALLAFFAYRALRASWLSEDSFRRLLCCAYVFTLVGQSLLNLAVVSGFVPATGVPLPFFSAGGSSQVTMLFMAGILVNLSRKGYEREAFHE